MMHRGASDGRARTVGALAILLAISPLACEPDNEGYAPEQPIAYSHAFHAGELRIPCQYCHYTAERGRYAGIPPAQVCMNCHKEVAKDRPAVRQVAAAIASGKPIAWVRVHWLPDFVYFNHSAHVNGGVACQSCHGPVQEMGRVTQWAPLTMGWCLDCHRKRAPKDVRSAPGASARANRLTDCVTCHH